MKTATATILATILFAGCPAPQKPQTHPSPLPQDYAPHSAMNSLDYFGVYEPETTRKSGDIRSITLEPYGRFSLTARDGSTTSGRYMWDLTGTTITLEWDGGTQFFVGENFLKRLGGSRDGQTFRKQDQPRPAE